MHYDTALRFHTSKRLEDIGSAEILIGIPCYNNETTIAHVIQMVTHGLAKHYPDQRCVIFIADGGSTDDSREIAQEIEIQPWQEKIISIYRGAAGKGSALRSIFEAAQHLRIAACAVVDSDLRSITSEWVRYLLEPVMLRGYQFVAPVYLRHKYDGSITNNIVYNLTRTLYGKQIRQPIGGDFAFSRDVAKFYMEQEVWESDVARFGIDIWMTTNAITNGFRVCQSHLGVKIHDAKDPGKHLGPMFRQVIWTLFSLMEKYESNWRGIRGSEPVPTFQHENPLEPEAIEVDLEGMIQHFKIGFHQFSPLWKKILCKECYEAIWKAAHTELKKFDLPVDAWIRALYEVAATFHSWSVNRNKLIDMMTPLYYARVASFVRKTWEMSSLEAETVVEEQALRFEEHKDYLIQVWDQESGSRSAA